LLLILEESITNIKFLFKLSNPVKIINFYEKLEIIELYLIKGN